MYNFYERIPFGVILLDGKSLEISFVNSKFKKLFDIDDSVIEKTLESLHFMMKLNNIFEKCFLEKKEKQLSEIEILDNRYFDFIISPTAELLQIFVYETTDKAIKFKKEREKFINISTELKTKCDIIEILRTREKEHLMHLKDVINNISEGLIVIDSNGRFTLSNKAAYTITELNAGELMDGSKVYSKYNIENSDENGESVITVYNEYFKKYLPIKNFVSKITDKATGKVKYIEINGNPIFNKDKQVVYTIITLKDVTETKLHQINSEEQANFIRDVVNTIDVPIAVLKYPELEYKLYNKKYEDIVTNMLGVTELSDTYSEQGFNNACLDDKRENLINTLIYSGNIGKEHTYSPFSIIDKLGNERFYKIKISPHKGKGETVKSLHIHGLDITEEVNHNLELEKVTKLKDEFFTVISHELRTPLTIIYSSIELAYDIYRDEITANMDKTLGRIHQNCSRLLKLINNVLDLSKAEAGFLTLNSSKFEMVYATELVVSSVNLYANSKGIQLIFDTNEEEAEIELDKDKYEKVLLNLLSNAIKFTGEGKHILVSLEVENDFITLSVKDEGIGIPSNKIDYIFDRFAQVNTSLSRRAEGTGIGLSLVKEFVELMEGEITVLSEEGVGTEFRIKFSRNCTKSNNTEYFPMIDTNMSDKVNIEFSDIN